MSRFQLNFKIKQIPSYVLEVISRKCAGNPLFSIHYFINMLFCGFLEITKKGRVESTDIFKQSYRIDNWNSLPVPRHAMKQTMQSLSNFFFSIKSKGPNNLKPGELNNATIAIILLKVATVLGREFQVDALKYISPLGRSGQNYKQVDESIRLLEMHDFIEIVD